MATTAPSLNAEPGEPPGSRPSLLRRSSRNVPSAVWYALGVLGVALIVVFVQIGLYARRSEPRDARAIVERELRMNTLQPGERIVRSVPVFRRSGVDYFRQTRGLLVLTDRRLVYLGAPPRDITGSSDAPPTFDQREFRIDTLVRLDASFAMLGLSRALTVETPDGDVELGIPSGAWPRARLMQVAWDGRHQRLRAIGVWGQKVRDARAELGKLLAQYKRQPVYHLVRPGDAISSIASWYEVTPEEIQKQNSLVGNKIKVGQRLLIRAGSP